MSTFNWLPVTELYKYAKEGALILALTDHGQISLSLSKKRGEK